MRSRQPFGHPFQERPQVLNALDIPSFPRSIPPRTEALGFVFFFVGDLKVYSHGTSWQNQNNVVRLLRQGDKDKRTFQLPVDGHPGQRLKRLLRTIRLLAGCSRLSRLQGLPARFSSPPNLAVGEPCPVRHAYLSLSHQHSQGLDDGPGQCHAKQKTAYNCPWSRTPGSPKVRGMCKRSSTVRRDPNSSHFKARGLSLSTPWISLTM